MARVVPGGNAVELDIGRTRVRRHKGAFEVPDKKAKQIAEATGGFIAGTNFMSDNPEPTGPWCEHGLRPYFCEECKE